MAPAPGTADETVVGPTATDGALGKELGTTRDTILTACGYRFTKKKWLSLRKAKRIGLALLTSRRSLSLHRPRHRQRVTLFENERTKKFGQTKRMRERERERETQEKRKIDNYNEYDP